MSDAFYDINFEALNPKFETNPNFQMFKIGNRFEHSDL